MVDNVVAFAPEIFAICGKRSSNLLKAKTSCPVRRMCRGPARVNSDKRHGPKSSDSADNEIATRDNLPRANCDSDDKADNKRQAFLNTDTRRFKILTGDMGPPPPPPEGPLSSQHHPISKESLIYSFKNCQRAGQCYSDSEWLNHRCVILVLVECTLLTVKRRSLLKLGFIQGS